MHQDNHDANQADGSRVTDKTELGDAKLEGLAGGVVLNPSQIRLQSPPHDPLSEPETQPDELLKGGGGKGAHPFA